MSESTSDTSDQADYENPALPDELLQLKSDYLIGDTVISKQKVLNILLKLVEEIKSRASSEASNESREVKELDEEIENDLCNLWDISADNDVCKVLDELNSIDIFEQYISSVHGVYPRAVEILIGILGNMASLDARICEKILLNQNLIKFCTNVLFYDLNDTQTLIQLLRLFNVFVLNEQFQKQFINENITIDDDFIKFSSFILDQSLNHNLLDLIVEFLINLFDIDEKTLNKFATDDNFVTALFTAILTRSKKVVTDEDGNEEDEDANLEMFDLALKNYFICLQLLSTCEVGVEKLCQVNKSLLDIFEIYVNKYLDYFESEKNSFDSNVYFKNENFIKNFICYFSVFNLVFTNTWSQYQSLNAADSLATTLHRLVEKLVKVSFSFLNKFEKIQKEEDDVDGNIKDYKQAFSYIEELSKFDAMNEIDKDGVKSLTKTIHDIKKLI